MGAANFRGCFFGEFLRGISILIFAQEALGKIAPTAHALAIVRDVFGGTIRETEVREKKALRLQFQNVVERTIPDFEIDIGRRNRGKNERIAFDANSGGVADVGGVVRGIPEGDVMRRVAGSVENLQGTVADGNGFSAAELAQIFTWDGEEISVELLHFVGIEAGGAAEELCGIGHVRRASFVHVNRKAWIFAHERADRTGVIEMDVREENGVEVLDGESVGLEMGTEGGQGGCGAGVDEGADSGGFEQDGTDGTRTAGPLQIEDARRCHWLSVPGLSVPESCGGMTPGCRGGSGSSKLGRIGCHPRCFRKNVKTKIVTAHGVGKNVKRKVLTGSGKAGRGTGKAPGNGWGGPYPSHHKYHNSRVMECQRKFWG